MCNRPEDETNCPNTCKILNQEHCTRRRSVEECGRCLETDQCKRGYCCPWMRKCIPDSTTECHLPIANCQIGCSTDWPSTDCDCMHKCYPDKDGNPNKWVYPTCR